MLVVPLFEKQARGRLPQLGGDHRRRRLAARRVSQDAHPRRSALQREVLLHAGRRGARRSHRPHRRGRQAGERLPRLEDALREHRRADLLGPVVSRGRAHHERCSAPTSCSIRRRSAGIRRRRRSSARRRSTRGARSSARTRSPTASSSRRPTAIGHEDDEPGTDGIEFFGHSFIADPFGRVLAEAGHRGDDPHRDVRPAADRGHAPQLALPARPPRSTRTRRSLSRYLGA